MLRRLPILFLFLFIPATITWAGTAESTSASPARGALRPLQHRWLFVWRNMTNPKEVDRMIARFPRAAAAGYNGIAFSYDIPSAKAPELLQAAKQNRLDLIAIVMGGAKDRN